MSPDSDYLSIVRRHASRTPRAIAFEIAAGDRCTSLDYDGLIDRVQRLGEAFRRAGFRDGVRVAICMENRPAWPVAYLAVWYAGGVTVPLDPALDEEILARLLSHSEAVVCITSEELSTKLRAACAGLPSPPLLLCPDRLGGAPAAFISWDGEPIGMGVEDLREPADDDNGAALPDLELLASFDAFVNEHGSEAGDWRPAIAEEETLGTIMYTSGTTGDPKGVMIRQQALLENLRAGVSRVRFSPEDRFLAVLPLFHVLPLIANCLGPMYLGARVVFLFELTADAIMDAFRRHDITVFVCVPAFFYRFHDRLTGAIAHAPALRRRLGRMLIAASRAARRRFGWSLGKVLLRRAHAPFGRRLRLFITGGAKMNAQVYEDFLDWGFRLAQGYGLTEATAIITATPLDELRGDTVGRPIDGVAVQIHAPDDEGIGEIWARGPSLMTGYYKNAAATEASLVDGWLRTGDLGRLLDNGHLQITGRAKDVIVLASGKNIYPDELEGYYGQSELIEEICIVGIPDEAGRGERLHAIVVPDRDAARRRGYVNAREMILWDLESMGAELPGPQRLTSLELRNEPLPRTPTRKVKRFVLQQEVNARGPERHVDEDAASAEGAIAPDDLPPWAPEVLEVVSRYSKRRHVGHDAHLDLDLGLESLDRIEMLAELQKRRGVTLDDEAVGRVHTVAELIAALAEAEPSPGGGEKRTLSRVQDGTASAAGATDEAVADRWGQVLRESPEGIERYLRRKPAVETFLWLALRAVRGLWSLMAGYRADGIDRIPGDGPLILCANHASYVDPAVLCMALPRTVLRRVFFVGYAEYFEGVAGGMLGRMVRNVPIDPNRNLERAMQAAAEGLRRGMVLVIFPEGARSLDGSVREFRRGATLLAAHLGVPIAPAGIWGAHRVWSRQGKKQRHPVAISFGDVIDPNDFDDAEALTDALRARVVELVAESERCLCPGSPQV